MVDKKDFMLVVSYGLLLGNFSSFGLVSHGPKDPSFLLSSTWKNKKEKRKGTFEWVLEALQVASNNGLEIIEKLWWDMVEKSLFMN